jgi:chromosome partitioning protein
MTIVVVASTKGGVSKTTTALNLGVAATLEGKKVLLVDADSGHSLRAAMIVRHERGERERERRPGDAGFRDDLPFIDSDVMHGPDLLHKLKAREPHYDLIIVDVGGEGQASTDTRLALLAARRVIVPCRTSRNDTVRLAALHDAVKEAKGINADLSALIFPAQASTHAKKKDVLDFYDDIFKHFGYHEFAPMFAVMRDRDPYKHWAFDGEGVLEKRANRDTRPAQDEVREIYAEAVQ